MGDDLGYSRKGSLGREILGILGRELKPGGRRRFLYFLSSLIAIGVVLDNLNSRFGGVFGLGGASGISIYIGLILLLGRPSEDWGEDTLIRAIGLIWISVGLIAIISFIVSWLRMASAQW